MLLRKAWLAILLLFPIILWILPARFFDQTGVELCPSKLFFNIECFGCGMTRAVMHFHHFDFAEAFYYNYAVLIAYPILVFFWCRWVWQTWRSLRSGQVVL